jgi:hypothetical protein
MVWLLFLSEGRAMLKTTQKGDIDDLIYGGDEDTVSQR